MPIKTSILDKNPQLEGRLYDTGADPGIQSTIARAWVEAVGSSTTLFTTQFLAKRAPAQWTVPTARPGSQGHLPDEGKARGTFASFATAKPTVSNVAFTYSARSDLEGRVSKVQISAQNPTPAWFLTDLATASSTGLPVAALQNGRGEYIPPTPETLTAAVATLKADKNGMLAPDPDPSADAAGAYPLTFVEYAIVPAAPLVTDDCKPRTESQAVMKSWLTYVTTAGQAQLPPGTEPLTPALQKQATDAIAKVGTGAQTGKCGPKSRCRRRRRPAARRCPPQEQGRSATRARSAIPAPAGSVTRGSEQRLRRPGAGQRPGRIRPHGRIGRQRDEQQRQHSSVDRRQPTGRGPQRRPRRGEAAGVLRRRTDQRHRATAVARRSRRPDVVRRHRHERPTSARTAERRASRPPAPSGAAVMTLVADPPVQAPAAAETPSPAPTQAPARRRPAPFTPARIAVTVLAWLGVTLAAVVLVLYGVGPLLEQRDQSSLLNQYRTEVRQAASQTEGLAGVQAPTEAPGAGDPVGILEINAMQLRQVVVEDVGPDQTRQGPGHAPGTAGVGQPGNSVVVGRRSMFGGPFHDLAELRRGDRIVATTTQGRSLYVIRQVRQVEVTSPDPDAAGPVEAAAEGSGTARPRVLRAKMTTDALVRPDPDRPAHAHHVGVGRAVGDGHPRRSSWRACGASRSRRRCRAAGPTVPTGATAHPAPGRR